MVVQSISELWTVSRRENRFLCRMSILHSREMSVWIPFPALFSTLIRTSHCSWLTKSYHTGRSQLQKSYFFTCQCEKCRNNTGTYTGFIKSFPPTPSPHIDLLIDIKNVNLTHNLEPMFDRTQEVCEWHIKHSFAAVSQAEILQSCNPICSYLIWYCKENKADRNMKRH